MRADLLLVARGLAPTRSAAQRLISQGAVRWRAGAPWAQPRKAGEDLPDDCELELTDDAELRWASRGGLKLDAALSACALDVTGRVALDVGQGTGGFTDVLLARGATHVVGVDVGRDQLVLRLRGDARVTALEGVNARSLGPDQLGSAWPDGGFDLVVGDLSFISLALVLPALARACAPGADLMLLVKPQFELQPADIGKGGLVRDPAAHARVQSKLREACLASDLRVERYFDSAIAGGDGNRECFVWARKPRSGESS